MGVAILRDFDHNTEAILFSTPMKRKLITCLEDLADHSLFLFLFSVAYGSGMMTGFAVGKYVPWNVDWKTKELLPFSAWSYLQPFIFLPRK